MFNKNNIITPTETPDDIQDRALRPKILSDFIGQDNLRKNLSIFIEATKSRNEPLDHVLFYGPPGLGKTTLSNIIAQELGVGFKVSSGPMLTKAGDLAAILSSLQEHDVLFIDEIHRLSSSIEEVLYSAMEDYAIDIIIGEGPTARTIKINLPKFTLVGATTRLGLLSNPLRDRFGIPMKLEFYTESELKEVIRRGAKLLSYSITDESLLKLAKCARGTPRIAIRLLKRIRDFASVQNKNYIDDQVLEPALNALGVDSFGLDGFDKSYINFIITHYGNGPVGIETIAAGLSEDKDTLEDTIEPYLIQIGFLNRTPRGRVLTQKALNYMDSTTSLNALLG